MDKEYSLYGNPVGIIDLGFEPSVLKVASKKTWFIRLSCG